MAGIIMVLGVFSMNGHFMRMYFISKVVKKQLIKNQNPGSVAIAFHHASIA